MAEREELFLHLVDAIERAESESQVILVNAVMRALPTSPNAALGVLERRWPREWSRTERHELSGPEGGPVQLEDFRVRLSERAERIAARLLAPLGPGDDADPTGAPPAPSKR